MRTTGSNLATAELASRPAPLRRIHVVVNHRSGTNANNPVARRIESFFLTRGMPVRVDVARTAGHLLDACGRAAGSDADVVVAAGGDGTVAAVASALVGTNTPLGVLPLGTFNYFARTLGVPLDLDEALEVIASGRPAAVDVGDLNGRLFVNNSSIGLYAAVLQQRERTYRQFRRSRIASYLSAAFALTQPPALVNLRLVADGTAVARRTPLLFVGINRTQLEDFGIPGGECLDHGRMALYITRPLGTLTLWRLALRALLRGLHGAPELEIVCARELQVSLRPKRIRVALDGELVTMMPPLVYRLRPAALRVLVPPPAEASASNPEAPSTPTA